MFRFESWESECTSASDVSSSSLTSMGSADFSSVFGDDIKEPARKNEELRCSAQQLAVNSASQGFPTFLAGEKAGKCAMLHWACHVGWCLCKYQYQPLTPLHLLPNTPITDNCHLRFCASKQETNKEYSTRSKTTSASSVSSSSVCDVIQNATSNVYFNTQSYSVERLQDVEVFSIETSV